MFDWLHSGKPPPETSAAREPLRGFAAPDLLLKNLARRAPQYLDDVDQGRLIYPACKRTLSDAGGDVATVWDHTRLEAMRYLSLIHISEPTRPY